MPNKFRSVLHKLASNPKRIFLIDSFGAFFTAFLLSTILTRLEEEFGMPRKVLIPLSIVACVYAIYSLGCYFLVNGKWRPFLKIIAVANLIYCCVTTGLVILFCQSLTIWGVVYFTSEIIIITGLVFIEALAISKSNGTHISETNLK